VRLAYIWIVSHLSAKNYRNWWKFDEVLTKTNLLGFFGHGVHTIIKRLHLSLIGGLSQAHSRPGFTLSASASLCCLTVVPLHATHSYHSTVNEHFNAETIVLYDAL